MVQVDDATLRRLLLEVMLAIMRFSGFDLSKVKSFENLEDVLEVVAEESEVEEVLNLVDQVAQLCKANSNL